MAVYYKQWDGTPGTVSIEWSDVVPGDMRAAGTVTSWSGVDTISPIDASASTTTSVGPFQAIGGVTTLTPNSMMVGTWGGPNTGIVFGYPGGMNGILQMSNAGGQPGRSLTTSYVLQVAAGDSGAKTAQSFDISTNNPSNSSSAIVLVALKAFQGPSRPTITAPVTGETITVGRTYAVTWTASTDPNIAQASLQYNLDYSLNDGLSWTQIVALTSAGAVTTSWNTTGIAASTQVKLRLRAYNGTEYSAYHTTGRFILAADVIPGAPVSLHGEQPSGTTVTTFDRAQTLTIKGTFSDLGDVQTGFQIDWGTDGITYGTASGTIASAILSLDFSGGTFSAGLVYFRARTKDTAGTFGPYAYLTLTAASAPASPNITSPTSGSPPTAPLPTLAWTSTGQVSYRIRLTTGGAAAYTGSFVNSSSTSVQCPLPLLNLTTYTFTLDYKDSSGLTSPSDSETFLVQYVGPAKPSVTVS